MKQAKAKHNKPAKHKSYISVKIGDKRYNCEDISKATGITISAAKGRIRNYYVKGKPIESILAPKGTVFPNVDSSYHRIEYHGRTYHYKEVADIANIHPETARQRIKKIKETGIGLENLLKGNKTKRQKRERKKTKSQIESDRSNAILDNMSTGSWEEANLNPTGVLSNSSRHLNERF